MLNLHQIIGRLGNDPEVRYLPSGDAVANFSMATTERWTEKGTNEKREETQWHRCTAFGRLAEIVGEYLKKGSLAYVSGKSKANKWTDKAGVERYSTEIVVGELKMLGDRSQGEGAPQRQQRGAPQQHGAPGRATPAARQQPAPRPASGFDDMDDPDIPF